MGKFCSVKKLKYRRPCYTLISKKHFHPSQARNISDNEVRKAASFPLDYDFNGNDPAYVCGMSVPPYMTERIATRIAGTCFKRKEAA